LLAECSVGGDATIKVASQRQVHQWLLRGHYPLPRRLVWWGVQCHHL